ncbi:hypothetical protein OG21DRAFT_810216 [Imleria badia]|nr:hypothetical protein OG21DRAFT_810216 [Imleria badia]
MYLCVVSLCPVTRYLKLLFPTLMTLLLVHPELLQLSVCDLLMMVSFYPTDSLTEIVNDVQLSVVPEGGDDCMITDMLMLHLRCVCALRRELPCCIALVFVRRRLLGHDGAPGTGVVGCCPLSAASAVAASHMSLCCFVQ